MRSYLDISEQKARRTIETVDRSLLPPRPNIVYNDILSTRTFVLPSTVSVPTKSPVYLRDNRTERTLRSRSKYANDTTTVHHRLARWSCLHQESPNLGSVPPSVTTSSTNRLQSVGSSVSGSHTHRDLVQGGGKKAAGEVEVHFVRAASEYLLHALRPTRS